MQTSVCFWCGTTSKFHDETCINEVGYEGWDHDQWHTGYNAAYAKFTRHGSAVVGLPSNASQAFSEGWQCFVRSHPHLKQVA